MKKRIYYFIFSGFLLILFLWREFEVYGLLIDGFAEIFSGNNDLQKLLIKYLEIAVDYWRSEQVSIEIVLNN